MSQKDRYEKPCDRCGEKILMAKVEGKWYARNLDGSNHYCQADAKPAGGQAAAASVYGAAPQRPKDFSFPPEQEGAIRRIVRDELEKAFMKATAE